MTSCPGVSTIEVDNNSNNQITPKMYEWSDSVWQVIAKIDKNGYYEANEH